MNFPDLFKKFVWDLAIREATFSLLASLSLSITSPLGSFIYKLIIFFSDKIYPYFVKEVKIETIKLSNDTHQEAFEKAQIRLKIIAVEKGIDSNEFKKAHEDEKNKFYNLVESTNGFMRIN